MTFQPHQHGNFVLQEQRRTNRQGLIISVGVTIVAVVLAATGTLVVIGEHAVAGKARPQVPQRPGAGSSVMAARELAEQFATALSADSAAPLVEISCTKPNKAQIEAFNAEAERYDHTFTVIESPTVRGDVATGTMQGRVGELTFTLHKRGFGWCAEFQWSGLVN